MKVCKHALLLSTALGGVRAVELKSAIGDHIADMLATAGDQQYPQSTLFIDPDQTTNPGPAEVAGEGTASDHADPDQSVNAEVEEEFPQEI